MYNDHFGIQEKPFTMAPDPRYLYMSDGHREAFAHLLYGINEDDGGFVLLTGEVGTGKTTVCRCLLEQLPEKTNVAMILNPKVTSIELLASICDEFQISYPPDTSSIKVLVDLLNTYLLAAHGNGDKNVLIIDEAQNLSPEVLEQIRLLTNLETNQKKLLQVILLGQPELLEILARPEMRQLVQRVTARYNLRPLTEQEIIPYVRHRMTVAGLQRQVFTPSAMAHLYRRSKGIPRMINILCDRALLGAFVLGQETVDDALVREAAREVLWTEGVKGPRSPLSRYKKITAGVAAIILALGLFFLRDTPRVDSTPQPMAQVEQAPSPASEPAMAKENTAPLSADLPQPLAEPESDLPFLPKLAWPGELPVSASWDLAQQSLFSLWGAPFNTTGDDACAQAERAKLKCFYQNGGMGSLLALNRPALLRMTGSDKQEFYITLIRAEGDTAVISIAGMTARIAMEEIALHWSGDYVLLWNPPEGYVDSIRPGRVGPEVVWLDKQLATIFKRPETPDGDFPFAGELIQEVKQFQFAQGLIPDGIAGVQTLIRISSEVSGDSVPKLVSKKQ